MGLINKYQKLCGQNGRNGVTVNLTVEKIHHRQGSERVYPTSQNTRKAKLLDVVVVTTVLPINIFVIAHASSICSLLTFSFVLYYISHMTSRDL